MPIYLRVTLLSRCTANRKYPTQNGRGLTFAVLIPLILLVVPVSQLMTPRAFSAL